MSSCGNASTGWRNYTSRIPAWLYVNTTSVSIDAIRNALNTHGPLVTTFDVYYDFYYYTGGIYKYTSGKYQGGHAVLIVGYRDDPLVDGGGYFIVKNSWGLDWGEDGYFNIAYSQIGSPVYFGEWTIAYKQPTQPSSPTAPNNLTVTAASSTQINIRWTDNATNEEAFKIERCTGHDCTDFSQIATVGAGEILQVIATLVWQRAQPTFTGCVPIILWAILLTRTQTMLPHQRHLFPLWRRLI